jgi:hypothetical protein
MPYGVCKICGCTDNDPCHNPAHGNCWWVDDSHELCSHCADKTIADDPATQHCINSNGFDPYPGIERKDLASLGCPFPDDTGDMCSECSHMSFSSVFTGECDLGIKIR